MKYIIKGCFFASLYFMAFFSMAHKDIKTPLPPKYSEFLMLQSMLQYISQSDFGRPQDLSGHLKTTSRILQQELKSLPDKELFHTCAVDLCGTYPKELVKAYQSREIKQDPPLPPKDLELVNHQSFYFSQEIKPLMQKASSYQMQYAKDYIKQLNHFIDQYNQCLPPIALASPHQDRVYSCHQQVNPNNPHYIDPEELCEKSMQIIYNISDLLKHIYSIPYEPKEYDDCSTKEGQEKSYKELIKSRDQLITLGMSNKNIIFHNNMEYCQASLWGHRQVYKKTKVFKDNFEYYKERFLNTLFTGTEHDDKNANLRTLLEQHINLDSVNIPGITEQDFIEKTKQRINKFLKKMDTSTKPIVIEDFPHPLHSRFCPSFLGRHGLGGPNVFNSLSKEISISIDSAMFPNAGKQVLAHELAHLVSVILFENYRDYLDVHGPHPPITYKPEDLPSAYSKYLNIRQCALDRYPEEKSDSFYAPEIALLPYERSDTEENTADIISSLVFPDEPFISTCLMLYPSKDGLGLNKDQMRILNFEFSEYSTSFLRVLMEGLHKREHIPLSCQQVMERYKNKINFNTCF